MRLLSLTVLGFLGILTCCGCAEPVDLGPTGTISGTLTYNGEPLSEGTGVVFMEQKRGFAGSGKTDAKGNFAITFFRKSTGPTPEMPIGNYIVMIQPPAGDTASAEMVESEEALTPDEVSASNQKQRFVKTEFPMKYRQPSTSGLTREIKEGENTFEIDLK